MDINLPSVGLPEDFAFDLQDYTYSQDTARAALDDIINDWDDPSLLVPNENPPPTHAQFREFYRKYFSQAGEAGDEYIVPASIKEYVNKNYEFETLYERYDAFWTLLNRAYSTPYEIAGNGVLTRDVGRLPPQVRNLLEKVKDEKITSVQVWRYPLLEPLQNILKKIVKLPYDSIFHSGVNLNGKYNLEKDNLLKFTKGKQRGDTPQNASKVYKVEKDITFGELFDKLRKTMGDAGLTQYNARTNNCQDFSLAILKVLGVSNNELKTFIKQDANKIFKSAGFFEKVVEAGTKLNTLKEQVIDRLTQGEGRGVQEGGACSCHQEGMGGEYIHNYALPRCKIQY